MNRLIADINQLGENPIDAQLIAYLANEFATQRHLEGEARAQFIAEYTAHFREQLELEIFCDSDWWLVVAVLCHDFALRVIDLPGEDIAF